MWPYVLAIVLLGIGLYGMIAKKNVIKIIVGLLVVEYAVNLFLVLLSCRPCRRRRKRLPPVPGRQTGSLPRASVAFFSCHPPCVSH